MVGSCIAMLARYCFSIPGTDLMYERVFSLAGWHKGRTFAELSTEDTERTLFVLENLSREIF